MTIPYAASGFEIAPGARLALARRCLRSVCRQLEHLPRDRARMAVKDAAYAWRHMIFYLSMADTSARSAFPTEMHTYLATRPEHLRHRLEPALAGLTHTLAGGGFHDDGTTDNGGRRLLGWQASGHWLLARTPA